MKNKFANIEILSPFNSVMYFKKVLFIKFVMIHNCILKR